MTAFRSPNLWSERPGVGFLSNNGSASATVNLYPNNAQGPDGLGAKTRQLDVRSSASVEVEAIRERWAEQVNDALELAQVAERVDHRSYARQGVEMKPAVTMGYASAAIERRAYAEQIAAG